MEIFDILNKHSFVFKKALGQNFLTDVSLLSAIASDAGVTPEDTVVEIGAGGGSLTRALADKAKRVIAFDVDEALRPVLKETLADKDNVEVVFADVLKKSDEELLDIIGGPFKVVANIPYYITTPLIMRFAESTLPVLSMTVTIQDEVARRLVAAPATPDYGAITVSIALRGNARITRTVSRRMFRPAPNVDSAVVRIDFDRDKFGADIEPVVKLARCGFQMRRKTLVNNLAAIGYPKEIAQRAIKEIGFDENVRGERLSAEDYVRLRAALDSDNR